MEQDARWRRATQRPWAAFFDADFAGIQGNGFILNGKPRFFCSPVSLPEYRIRKIERIRCN